MKKFTIRTLLSSAAIAVAAVLLPSGAQAQFYNDAMGQRVYQLNDLASAMTWQYTNEVRYSRGCPHAAALLKAMRNYSTHTTRLNRAYNGTCVKTFKKAACDARTSLTRVQNCSKKAHVSQHTRYLIAQSCPIATWVHRNSSSFRPVRPVVPTYGYPQHQVPTCNQPVYARPPAHVQTSAHYQYAPQIQGPHPLATLLLNRLANKLH